MNYTLLYIALSAFSVTDSIVYASITISIILILASLSGYIFKEWAIVRSELRQAKGDVIIHSKDTENAVNSSLKEMRGSILEMNRIVSRFDKSADDREEKLKTYTERAKAEIYNSLQNFNELIIEEKNARKEEQRARLEFYKHLSTKSKEIDTKIAETLTIHEKSLNMSAKNVESFLSVSKKLKDIERKTNELQTKLKDYDYKKD